METDNKKSQAVKKSVSMPQELWEFVTTQKGEFGDASRVIQKALRELRDRVQKLADQAQKKGEREINKATGKK